MRLGNNTQLTDEEELLLSSKMVAMMHYLPWQYSLFGVFIFMETGGISLSLSSEERMGFISSINNVYMQDMVKYKHN